MSWIPYSFQSKKLLRWSVRLGNRCAYGNRQVYYGLYVFDRLWCSGNHCSEDCSVKENSNCNFTFNCTHAYTYRKPAAFVISFGHGILIDFDTYVFINFGGSPIPTCPYARLDVMSLLLIQLVFNLEMVLLLFCRIGSLWTHQ